MKKIIVKIKEELIELITKEIKKQGVHADLNHLDISNLTDLSNVFYKSIFNGNISQWDTSNVEDMSYMFYGSQFNQDISQWDTSIVENMSYMFEDSKFNQDLSNWLPLSLKDSIEILKNSQCSLPYWANCQTNEEIREKIEIYQTEKEKKKLDRLITQIKPSKNQKFKL